MTPEKILEVVETYQLKLEDMGVPRVSASHDRLAIGLGMNETLAHCHQMLDKMQEFVVDGRIEKAFRWLGFVQGCLWAEGVYSIGEMANHNRPIE